MPKISVLIPPQTGWIVRELNHKSSEVVYKEKKETKESKIRRPNYLLTQAAFLVRVFIA